MDGAVLPDLSNLTTNLEECVAKVNRLLKPFFAVPLEQQLGKLEALERAKLEVLLAFCLNTLTFVYIKTQGVSTKEHPVRTELERIKHYYKKIREASGAPRGGMRLDKEAAKRFVNHTLITNPAVSEEIKKRKNQAQAEAFLANLASQQSNGTEPQTSTPDTASGVSTPETSEVEEGDKDTRSRRKRRRHLEKKKGNGSAANKSNVNI